jgi:hypothetical protein
MEETMSHNYEHKHGHVPFLLWPFYAIFRLIGFIIEMVGRLVGLILGMVLILAGVLLSLTVVGAIIGIPVALFGVMLMIRCIF